jgi:probable HAF family extracellular repeat protein
MLSRGRIGAAFLATASIAALTLPGEGAAHGASANLAGTTSAALHYALIDVGTLGGPHAELDGPAVQITGQGAVLGLADTRTKDSDYPNKGAFGGDPYVEHAFSGFDGHMTDLGALPGNNSSAVFEVNGNGIGVGSSETGAIDALTHQPAQHPVLFEHGAVTDLGTLQGGTEGFAYSINEAGQIAGFSNNGVPDPFGIPGFDNWVTEYRTFIWQKGLMSDIGTLGGPDAVTAGINEHGQIAGDSYVNNTANTTTHLPTMHPYLWQNGQMRDLGSLGGTMSGTNSLNNTGEVVGQSNLAGDTTYHPFLWDGTHLRDLGTLGGADGTAVHINDSGDVTGWAETPSAAQHAFLWKNGTMADLTGASSSQWTHPEWLNNADQVVGYLYVGDSSHALLWTGGHQYDLNTLVGSTAVDLTEAAYINDSGEITANGIDPTNGQEHVYLLKPLGPNACGVPKLKGETLRAAKSSIKTHDCTVGAIRHAASGVIRRGHIISQNPRPGRWLTHGARINLVVSKGR